jgi:hypothetical protein
MSLQPNMLLSDALAYNNIMHNIPKSNPCITLNSPSLSVLYTLTCSVSLILKRTHTHTRTHVRTHTHTHILAMALAGATSFVRLQSGRVDSWPLRMRKWCCAGYTTADVIFTTDHLENIHPYPSIPLKGAVTSVNIFHPSDSKWAIVERICNWHCCLAFNNTEWDFLLFLRHKGL